MKKRGVPGGGVEAGLEAGVVLKDVEPRETSCERDFLFFAAYAVKPIKATPKSTETIKRRRMNAFMGYLTFDKSRSGGCLVTQSSENLSFDERPAVMELNYFAITLLRKRHVARC